MCWKRALPCVQLGDRAEQNTREVLRLPGCQAYYKCAEGSSDYIIQWRCPGTYSRLLEDNQTMCAQQYPQRNCPPPVVCPTSDWQAEYNRSTHFPTEFIIGGTLGTLSLIAIVFIILAVVRKWQLRKRSNSMSTILSRHHRKHRHRPLKKTRLVPWFGESILAYDYREKPYRAYDNFATDVYIAAAHSTPRAERTAYADNSSDNALFTVEEESRYEPSIIAGSFVYHPPSNLPPHLTGDHHHNLSYDSFKNEHLYENQGRGVVSSTLNNHHQPPDFYL